MSEEERKVHTVNIHVYIIYIKISRWGKKKYLNRINLLNKETKKTRVAE